MLHSNTSPHTPFTTLIRPRLAKSLVRTFLTQLPNLRATHWNPTAVDKQTLTSYITSALKQINDTPTPPSHHATITSLYALLKDPSAPPWRRLPNTVSNPISKSVRTTSKKWGRAVAVIDTDPGTLLGYLQTPTCDLLSYQYDQCGCLPYQLTPSPTDPRCSTCTASVRYPSLFGNRVHYNSQIGDALSNYDASAPPNSYILASVPTTRPLDSPTLRMCDAGNGSHRVNGSLAVVGETSTLAILVPVAPNITELTYYTTSTKPSKIPGDGKLAESLSFVNHMQVHFARNIRVTDEETRDAFTEAIKKAPVLPPGPIREEQKNLVERCEEMERLAEDYVEEHEWEIIKSKSPFTSTYMIIPPPNTFQATQVGMGKVTSTLDCTPAQGLAWYFDYCSRSWMKRHADEGHLARFVHSRPARNDKVVVSVLQMPTPLAKRETCVRMVWVKIAGGGLQVCFESMPSSFKPDYGQTFTRLARTHTRGIVRFTLKPGVENQTLMVMHQMLDGGGPMSRFSFTNERMLRAFIPSQVNIGNDGYDLFSKDEEYDKVAHETLLNHMKSMGTRRFNKHETGVLQEVQVRKEASEQREERGRVVERM